MIRKILLLCVCALSLGGCVAVKEYEKVMLNDPDMVLGTKKIDRFMLNFHAYREAAAGANGGKTGGGCGCN